MRRVLTRRQIAVQGGLAGAIPVVLGRAGAPHGTVVIADEQTAGRGLTQRVGRVGAAAAAEGERDEAGEDAEGEGSCGRKPGNARRR